MPYAMQIDSSGEPGAPLSLDIYWVFVGVQENKTSAEVEVWLNGATTAGSFGYEIVQMPGSFTGTYTTATMTEVISGTARFNLTSLVPGKSYQLRVRAYSGANRTGSFGQTISTQFVVPVSSNNASILETFHKKEREGLEGNTGTITPSSYDVDILADKIGVIDALKASNTKKDVEKTTKSLFKLSNNAKSPDEYSIAYKSYDNLLTNKTYYAFGTSLFFKSNVDTVNQSGGLAFFVDNAGQTGYFIQVSTSANAAINNTKDFKILKMKNGRLYQLPDSQTVSAKTLSGIFGGKTYKIDVRVKVNTASVEIYCYVNGFKITALDANPTDNVEVKDPTPKLSPTKRVAMICNQGTVYFDYIYGMHLTKDQFDQESLFNIYEGQYSEAALSFLYGNKTLENNSVSSTITNGFIEEFGAVARELRVLKTKYNSRPAFPLYASTGVNSFARILGQRLTSFGAEIYVINNSGTYIPLDDSEFYSFYILGKYISLSGVLEYVDSSASEYSVQEPVIFESKWIQKKSDVVNLGDWIKEVWSNKQRIITMQVFANPLLSVGDVITVTYPYNNLSGTEKFVITNINHEFRGGLQTTITARTL